MKNFTKNLYAAISGIALMVMPQLGLTDESQADSASSSSGSAAGEGSAAGDAAAKTAIGGVSAGTIAAVGPLLLQLQQYLTWIWRWSYNSYTSYAYASPTPTPTPTPTPVIEV